MKDWLKNLGGGGGRRSYTVDELMVLERWNEAEAALQARLKKRSRDLHARLKLAEVLVHLRKPGPAVEQYALVAQAYAEDGFYDKGIALLSRAARIAPADPTLPQRLARMREAKDQARTRALAVGALKAAVSQSGRGATAAVELEQIWQRLADSQLVHRLPPEQLQRLFTVVEIVRLRAGDTLVRRGQELGEIFVVVSATVEARARSSPESSSVTLRSFTSGDIIGDAAMLEHRPWPADYTASEPGAVLRLDREGLEKAMTGNPDPRQLLEALREQHQDREVEASLQRLVKGT